MNVVQFNSTDAAGGAAIAAFRLHQGLLRAGADSRLLVGQRKTDDTRVQELPARRDIIARMARRAGAWYGVNDAAILGTSRAILQHPWVRKADVLQFHNLHGGYFNYRAVAPITRFCPAVWTLHDMWGFTGHCAYSFDCERWKTGCGKCPNLDTYPSMRRDRTASEYQLKRQAYSQSRLVIITLCDWMTRLVKDSILNQFPVRQIPNGLDTAVYRPENKALSRAALGLPADGYVLLFAAQSLSDPRKGGGLLAEALLKLTEDIRRQTTVVTFGSGGSALGDRVNLPTVDLGYVHADRLKVLAYSAADLFVFPTCADNLPVVIQESLACGTPVVSCDIGGVPDMVRHLQTGWLAPAGSADGIREGIERLLLATALRTELAANCRASSVAEYGLETQSARYLEVYRALIQGEPL